MPLTNRVINGMAEASWGSEIPYGKPEGSLLARDFTPWDLGAFEDYVRKDDKGEPRGKPPGSMNQIVRDQATNQALWCIIWRRTYTRTS